MGIFGKKPLPSTSYGYQAPAGAVVTGWECPGEGCKRSDTTPPRRWPASCSACGTALDPMFAEPWAHDARRAEIDAVLRNPDDNPYLADVMRVESEVCGRVPPEQLFGGSVDVSVPEAVQHHGR
jgi:hypothetical protein